MYIHDRSPDIDTPGHGWVASLNKFLVSSNAAIAETNSTTSIATIDSGQSNCTVTCNIKPLSGAPSPGICYRYSDNSNYWIADADMGSSKLSIYQMLAGVGPTLKASTAKTYTLGTTYLISIRLDGNNHILTCDALTVNFTSATGATNTKHGLWANTTTANFDDFRIVL